MAKFKIVISASAEKSLKKIPKKDIGRIVETIENLSSNPYPDGCRKLTGEEGVFRVRQGQYRIIYEAKKRELLILVLKIGHRKDIYKG